MEDYIGSLSEGGLEILTSEISAYCFANGIVIGLKDSPNLVTHAPISLLPSILPGDAVDGCCDVSEIFNKLYNAIGRDWPFQLEVFRPIVDSDDFIRNLVSILDTLVKSRVQQRTCLLLARSDYMFHEVTDDAGVHHVQGKQIEMNTISVAFAGLSEKVSKAHEYILNNATLCSLVPPVFTKNPLIKHTSLAGFVEGLGKAVMWYRNNVDNDSESVVLMVIHRNDHNSADQRLLQYGLLETYGVEMLRLDLDVIHQNLSRDKSGKLYVFGRQVAVVYYRSCYSPHSLSTVIEVETVKQMECSLSIKCPSIGHHLAGSKKMQQLLFDKALMQKYISAKEADLLYTFMMNLQPVDKDSIAQALADPTEWVLKPQREGGGNNLWGENMIHALTTMTPHQLDAFILMKRIRPKTRNQAMLVQGKLTVAEALSEVGVYAVCLATDKEILHNQYVGVLLRTKQQGVDEGGVASGYSVLDSIIKLKE